VGWAHTYGADSCSLVARSDGTDLCWSLGSKPTRYMDIYSAFVGFEVLTPVVMKIYIIWDITPCSPLNVNRRFGGTCRLQGRRIIQNMKAGGKKSPSFDSQRATRLYILELFTLSLCVLSSEV
jgi:hypothetical protein